MAPLLLLWLPVILVGGYLAQGFALGQAVETLGGLGDAYEGLEVGLDSLTFAIISVATIFVAVLVSISGIYFIAKRPVLQLLQGKTTKDG